MKKLIAIFLLVLSTSLVFGQANGLVISNKASGGAIGTAAATVDVASLFNVNQTTASQTLTVPNLTNTTNGKTIHINNVGSTAFTLLSKTIEPGTGILLRWTGSAWSISGVGNASGDGGAADSSIFATQYDISLKVDKSGTKVLSDENYSTAEKSKLSGIATGATANSTDAQLRDRSTHTGQDQISDVSGLQTALDLKAPLASPALTGNPTVPAQLESDSSTRAANTAFVKRAVSGLSGGGGADSSIYATKYYSGQTFAPKFTSQAKNLIYAGPLIGSNAIPTFRAFSNFDLPLKNKYKAFLTNDVQAFGDSYTVGQQASPSTESYINKIAAANNCTITNNAVGGVGVWFTCQQHFTTTPSWGTYQSAIWMAGFNDLRRNGAAASTILKIKGCLRSTIVDQFLKYGTAASAVTNTGTWSNMTGIGSKSAASLSGNARQSSTVGNTLTYTSPVSSNVVVGTFNTDGTTYNYGRFTVSIDGTVVQTFDPNNRTDGVSDGTYDNGITQEVLVFENLRNSTHTVVITLLDAKPTVIDYFGVMLSGADCSSIFCSSVPHLTALGYITGTGTNGSDAAFDAADLAIESVVNEFPNYPAIYVPVNNYYIPATDVGADNIHPNNLGYTHLAQAFQAAIRENVGRFLFLRSFSSGSASEANAFIATGSNIFRLGCNNNIAGIATNTSLAKAQLNINTFNNDSNFEFYTGSTNNALSLSLKITKDGNLEALKTSANIAFGPAATNTAFFGSNTDIAVMGINRSISGSFANTSKAAALIYLRGVANAGTIEFYTSPTNNTTPVMAVNINENKRTFFGGSTSASALVHLAAGTATANTAPLKFTSGTNLTTPENGAFEYNGTNLFFTRTGATRENIMTTGSVNTVTPTLPNRTITVVIDGVTYYIAAKTTND